MVKIVSINSRYQASHEDSNGKRSNVFTTLWDKFTSLDKFYRLAFISMLLILVGTPIITTQQFSLLEHAATNKTAIISVAPLNGTVDIGQPFVVNLVVDGGGQAFNGAQASISVSSNLSVQSLDITPVTSGGCGFTFANTRATPTVADPSFAGAILNGSSPSCIVYALTVVPTTSGVGTISITKGSVKAYSNSAEIISSMQSGSYNLGITPTPTVNATPTPTPTPTPIPATPTPTPTTSLSPTPTLTSLQPPTIDSQPLDTYQTTATLSGTKTIDTVSVYVNNSTLGVIYPTTTTWQYPTSLSQGINNFSVFGKDATGISSTANSITITVHRLADIDGDGVINLTDLSMFGDDWENTGTLFHPLSDMNGDGLVDLTDFSILAKAYGN